MLMKRFVLYASSNTMSSMINKTVKWVFKDLVFLTWLVALGATFGSMVLSEVMDLVPCALCWYQRIFMFPLAFILGVGVYRKDNNAAYYVLPLSIAGSLIAFYHSLLQWGIIKEAVTTCSIDSSCAVPQINWLGFITIPFMSLMSFLVITGLMVMQVRRIRKNTKLPL